MKLLDLNFSPYSSRVRIMARFKSLPLTIVPPPFALRTPEFKAHFPLGKVPVLELDDGACLPESWPIMEYLEDIYPEVSLRPQDPLARAQMRVLGRIADLHLGPALFPLFGALRQTGGNANLNAQHGEATTTELVKLSRMLEEYHLPNQRSLNLGDIALVPTLYFVTAILPLFGLAAPLASVPLVADWWEQVNAVPAVKQTLDEVDQGFRGFLKQIGRN